MRRWLAQFAMLLTIAGCVRAGDLRAQVIGVNPQPIPLYAWSPTQNAWVKLPNTATAQAYQGVPGPPSALAGWNDSLGQWTPYQLDDDGNLTLPVEGSGGGGTIGGSVSAFFVPYATDTNKLGNSPAHWDITGLATFFLPATAGVSIQTPLVSLPGRSGVGGLALTEGANGCTAAVGVVCLWADSSNRLMQNPNNIGALSIPGIATPIPAGNFFVAASNGIDPVDGGLNVSCSGTAGTLPMFNGSGAPCVSSAMDQGRSTGAAVTLTGFDFNLTPTGTANSSNNFASKRYFLLGSSFNNGEVLTVSNQGTGYTPSQIYTATISGSTCSIPPKAIAVGSATATLLVAIQNPGFCSVPGTIAISGSPGSGWAGTLSIANAPQTEGALIDLQYLFSNTASLMSPVLSLIVPPNSGATGSPAVSFRQSSAQGANRGWNFMIDSITGPMMNQSIAKITASRNVAWPDASGDVAVYVDGAPINGHCPVWSVSGGVAILADNGSACGSSGGGTNVEINAGSTLATANFNNATPAASANGINVAFQNTGINVSAELVGDGTAGHFLNGTGVFGQVGLTTGVTGVMPPANGGTGVANTATLTLGTSNQNWAALGTGIVKNTTTTGALSLAAAADVIGMWTGTCSSTTFLNGAGGCAIPTGAGTVTHTLGALTALQIVIGNGSADVKVDTVASTDGAGNMTAASYTANGPTHGLALPAGTAIAGAAGTVVYGVDATSGFAEVNENATGLSRVCTATNAICSAGGVTSLSGDGTFITNLSSTGGVTLTLGNAGAHKWWGNNTGSTAAPGYEALTASDIPTGIPIGNVGSAGLSGTSPITISAAGAIACATCGLTGSALSQFASTTSAQLAGVLSDETGTGSAVFANSPTLVTPALGTPSAAVLTNATGLPLGGSGVTGTLGASNGGTGVAGTLTGPLFGNGTSPQTVATAAQLDAVLDTTETVTFSATPTFSGSTHYSTITLTANITSFTIGAAANNGYEKTIVFCQNATGGFTVAGVPANMRGFFATIGGTASLCSSQHYRYSTIATAWLADSPGVINE